MAFFDLNQDENIKERWRDQGNEKRSLDLNSFIELIEKRLNHMEERYTIDRIEEFVAVCENRDTGEMIQIDRNELPSDSKEGSILKYEKGKYKIDQSEQEKAENRIKEKMNRLWKEE